MLVRKFDRTDADPDRYSEDMRRYFIEEQINNEQLKGWGQNYQYVGFDDSSLGLPEVCTTATGTSEYPEP